MYRGQSVGVVVTAYDEEAFVGEVVSTVPTYVDRIYVVDDASPDGCWEIIRSTAAGINRSAEDPRQVVPIRHAENRGYGGAVKTGYRSAVGDGMDVVAVLNGDGQMDPTILHRFLHPVVSGRADYATGNRLLNRDDRGEMSRFRFVGNVLLSGLSKFATGYWQLSDPQNGYTAISADAIHRIDLDRVTDEYGFLNELLVELNLADCRVADVPMRAHYGDEESSIRIGRFVRRVSLLLLRNAVRRLRSRYVVRELHPAVLYYLVGVVALLVGILETLARVRRGDGPTLTGVLVGALAIVMGVECDAAETAELQCVVDPEEPPTPQPVHVERESIPTVSPPDAE